MARRRWLQCQWNAAWWWTAAGCRSTPCVGDAIESGARLTRNRRRGSRRTPPATPAGGQCRSPRPVRRA
ncbi:hypothetical protein G6F61_015239 [Rhizopus arrhizus]|nr:hypothetical protein G6F40_017254 [Rhizopus arrhizus]KAG1319601.1 hypothetical protein G6F61_015239 [Rhizopus arrhizus]